MLVFNGWINSAKLPYVGSIPTRTSILYDGGLEGIMREEMLVTIGAMSWHAVAERWRSSGQPESFLSGDGLGCRLQKRASGCYRRPVGG
jgi:hypothetical protein